MTLILPPFWGIPQDEVLDCDPFNDPGADQPFEALLNGPLPPETTMDPDELAAALFVGSVELALNPDMPKPPEMPPLDLALVA